MELDRRVTTQDISWFLDLNSNEQLNLNPPYQRRSVWTAKDRLFFLDTIFRGYPCPAIFLHKTINENGRQIYHVIDGKQRLETILLFVSNKISLSKEYGDTRLNGKKWKDLEGELELKKRLWNYVLSVEFIDINEGSIVENVFDRLNRNSRKLDRQELRHAKFDGWFINFCEAESEKKEWGSLSISTRARAKRMRDVQFISELFLITIEGNISGFDQNMLDDKYAFYDDPQSNISNFSEEETIEKIETVKTAVLEMEKLNSCVTKFSKSFTNFYSLWAVISKNIKDLSISDTADKYATFMQEVENTDLSTIQNVDDIAGNLSLIIKYKSNSIGASTDLPQRKARLDALTQLFIGTQHENI